MKADYIILAGETLILSLILVEGDLSPVTAAVCKMKKAGPRGTVPSSTTPVVATLTTSAATVGSGWDFILDAASTAILEPGFYVADASLTLIGGEIDKTEPILIEILPSVT